MANTTTLRIHPAIGISRVGNSPEYIIAPETSAGMPAIKGSTVVGGLPIQLGQETKTITDQDLRDCQGRLKPHAQRFRIFAYAEAPTSYPYTGAVSEVCVGSKVDGKTVDSITWQVHMANKKANNWVIPEDASNNKNSNNGIGGLAHYADGDTPNVRNGYFGTDTYPVFLNTDDWGTGVPPKGADKGDKGVDMADPERLTKLVIDAGPKTISSKSSERVQFDNSECSYIDERGKAHKFEYPQSWPENNFKQLFTPNGPEFSSLGAMETDDKGRLIVIGSPGYAASWLVGENNPSGSVSSPPVWQEGIDTPFAPPKPDDPFPLWSDIDNDGWFDDAADGPVYAALTFDDGTTRVIETPAWCACTDPSYAPQIRNVNTIWDEVYNAWLRSPDLTLNKNIFCTKSQQYQVDYEVSFEQDVSPIFRAAGLQMFTTDLPRNAISGHKSASAITADESPTSYQWLLNIIRKPGTGPGNELGEEGPAGGSLMPLALGDTGASFLTVTDTQYFFLEQWSHNNYNDKTESLTAGELLDKNTLTNLLGGRFSPGIDLTFIVRDPYLYNLDWTHSDVGPFRINAKTLDYQSAGKAPFLGVGYTPNRKPTSPQGTVEPGDLTKFMALPWHTDYNSCATHLPAPNPNEPSPPTPNPIPNNTLFWSWPAQRPVSVYTYEDYVGNGNEFYPEQRFSLRGTGTEWTGPTGDPDYANGPSSVGRYQNNLNMITNWFDIGVVVQGQAIEGFIGDTDDLFLEVQSQLKGPSDFSQPWPITTADKVHPEKTEPGHNG